MKAPHTQGFTVIEMLVAMAIFVIFTGVTLISFPRFSNRVSLDLLAHNVALTVREAQTFGLGVRRFAGSTAFPAYGVHFNAVSPSSKSFLLFGDQCGPGGVKDRLYTAPCPSPSTDIELLETFTIPPGPNVISKVCVTSGSVCTDVTSGLDVTFKSPRPDALIYANGSVLTAYADAQISFMNGRGDIRTVIIRKTGQISIQ